MQMHKQAMQDIDSTILIVDSTVQRPLDHGKVERIAADYNPAAIGVVTVSARDNTVMHVIDGQHRVAAVNRLGGDTLSCRVFYGLTLAEEAELFRLLNNTNRPSKLDLFRVRVVEGEPVAVAINDILSRNGWRVNPQVGHGNFAAVTAIERVYTLDAVAVERTIVTLTAAWGHDSSGVDGRLVEGVGRVFARYGDTIDALDLAARLARYPGGAGALIGKARGLRDLAGGTVPRAVGEIVVAQYNARRKTRALPDWKS